MNESSSKGRDEVRHGVKLWRSLIDRARMIVARTLGLPRDPEWRRVLAITDSRSMVDRLRRVNLLRLLRHLDEDGVPGSVVECGVARGGTAALMGMQALAAHSGRELWLLDSFVGLPEPTREDGTDALRYARGRGEGRLAPIGECVGTLDDVRGFLFGECGLSEDRIHLVPGWFQNTLPAFAGGPLALVHVDGDWFESVRLCLRYLWPSVSPGGYVVIDDYGHWEGARRATKEFLAMEGRGVALHRKGYTQAYFRKPH